MHTPVIVFCITFLLTALALPLQGQDCESCYEEGDCRMDLQKGYRIYSQSKGIAVTTRDTVELNVVFYGQKDYIFTFCTDKSLYPIHFTILDPESGTRIYDNRDDRYIESLGIGFDETRTLRFRIHVLAQTNGSTGKVDQSGCLGILFQYKNYEN